MSDEGRDLFALLVARDSAITNCFTPSICALCIPSQNPRVLDPLVIELFDTIQLYWHRGYFFDFLGSGTVQVEAAAEFLEQFWKEEILCGVCLKRTSISGGPVKGDEWMMWPDDYERLELRSWRGNRDRDVTK